MAPPRLTEDKLREAVMAMRQAGGNQHSAAALIGVSRSTFQSRLLEARRRGFADVEDPALCAKCGDTQLRSYATVREGEILDAVVRFKSAVSAAVDMGLTVHDVKAAVSGLEERASIRGYSPEHSWSHPVPPTHVAKGVSSYFNADGELAGQWVKSDLRQEAYNNLVKGAISAFMEDVPPLDVPPEPLDFQSDIIPWIQIGDAHIGMLAHAAEVGENFDLKIAETELCAAIGMLIDEMPACERIVVNDLGDATHYDNLSATTAASGHQLDADGRHPKMIRVYSRTMRYIVEKCLTKCRQLDVIINQGNHSRINDFWMRELLTAAYGHTGRVNVLDNDSVFIGYRMGNTFVMTHHSDKCKPDKLIGVMTTDFREDFGETQFHYIDTGHVHHHFVSREHPSVVIESWNHLPASDKYAHDAGWRSRRCISVVLRSRTYGDVGRRVLPIEAIRARLLAAGHPAQPARKGAYAV